MKRLTMLPDIVLDFESLEGTGASLRFSLPIVDKSEPGKQTRGHVATHARGQRILVPDDDRSIRERD